MMIAATVLLYLTVFVDNRHLSYFKHAVNT